METSQLDDAIINTDAAGLPNALRGMPGTLKITGECRCGDVATSPGAQPPDSQWHSLHSTQGP